MHKLFLLASAAARHNNRLGSTDNTEKENIVIVTVDLCCKEFDFCRFYMAYLHDVGHGRGKECSINTTTTVYFLFH